MSKSFWSKQGSRVSKRKARTWHECVECCFEIGPGEEYYEITYEGDDYQWHTVRVCSGCWEH